MSQEIRNVISVAFRFAAIQATHEGEVSRLRNLHKVIMQELGFEERVLNGDLSPQDTPLSHVHTNGTPDVVKEEKEKKYTKLDYQTVLDQKIQILRHIESNPHISTRNIKDVTGIATKVISNRCQQMHRDGYVTLKYEIEKRQNVYCITKKGNEFLKSFKSRFTA